METDTIYAIRQGILIAVRDAYGPATCERIQRHNELFGVSENSLSREFKQLLKEGYIEAVPFAKGYFRLTDRGAMETDFHPGQADPFVWGPRALT